MIEVKALTKRFGSTTALLNINLNLCAQDVFGIIGPSGAGKSTLVRCLLQLEQPTSGEIFLSGCNLNTLKPKTLRFKRQEIGVIFQHFHLLSSRTVRDNVALPLELHGIEDKDRVKELLHLVNLQERSDAYPAQLSGGERQRVGIARALALRPKLLLCDEPTSAIDPAGTQQILEMLQKLNRDLGLTILVITHEMDVIRSICNKVAVLDNGAIVEQGSVIDLFSNPTHPTTQKLLERRTQTLPPIFPSSKGRLLRLSFCGESAKKPIISSLIKELPIEVNILLGGVDCVEGTIVGNLTVELFGEGVEKALDYLRKHGIGYEVLS